MLNQVVSWEKKTNSKRGRNWTFLQWPVHLVYLQDMRQEYNPSCTRSETCQFWGSEVEAPSSTMD